jgi:hypothetical protein
MRTLIFLSAFIATLGFNSCDLIEAIAPDDWPIDTMPIDTIPIECEQYIEQIEPKFYCWFLNLDAPLIDTVYYFDNTPINPDTYFDTVYYSGVNIAGIKNTAAAAPGNNKIWVRSGTGAKHYLAFHLQGLNFRGALTFDQYWKELQSHPSVQLIRFSNTGYTCEQILQVLNFLLEDCKATPDIVDLRPVSIGTCVIPQEIKDELIIRGSHIWQ